MTYYTGTAVSSIHFASLLDGYLTANSWTNISTISALDKIYYSSGADGYERLYLRVTAGLRDYCNNQPYSLKPSQTLGDGYQGGVVFRMYQFAAAGGSDGYEEIGIKEAAAYIFANDLLYTQDFQQLSVNDITYKSRALTDFAFSTSSDTSFYDGINSFYNFAGTSSAFKHNFLLNSTSSITASSRVFSSKTGVGILNSSRQLELYSATNVSTSGQQFAKYNTSTGVTTSLANPSWANSSLFGMIATDGYDTIYAARGSNTTTFAYYTISSNTWTSSTALPASAGSTGSSNICSMIFVNKRDSGASNNRIYAAFAASASAATSFAFINLTDAGAPTGAWTSVARPLSSADVALAYYGGDFIFAQDASGRMMKYSISGGAWVGPTGTTGEVYNLNNRVSSDIANSAGCFYKVGYYYLPITEGSSNSFHAFVDSEKVICVMSTAASEKHLMYAGKFDSSYTRKNTITTASATAGFSSTFTVVNNQFSVGDKVIIKNTVDGTGTVAATDASGRSRKTSISEWATVVASSSNSVTLDRLRNTYPSGSIIGVDPQPVCVLETMTPSVQVLDYMPASNLDSVTAKLISKKYIFQCPASAAITNASVQCTRNGQTMAWPVILRAADSDLGVKEVRGRLSDVYIVSAGTLAEGDLIQINNENYKLFSFSTDYYNEARFFAIGPTG